MHGLLSTGPGTILRCDEDIHPKIYLLAHAYSHPGYGGDSTGWIDPAGCNTYFTQVRTLYTSLNNVTVRIHSVHRTTSPFSSHGSPSVASCRGIYPQRGSRSVGKNPGRTREIVHPPESVLITGPDGYAKEKAPTGGDPCRQEVSRSQAAFISPGGILRPRYEGERWR